MLIIAWLVSLLLLLCFQLMLIFFMSCLSFLLIFSSLSCKLRLFSPMLWIQLSDYVTSCVKKMICVFKFPALATKPSSSGGSMAESEEVDEISLLDLPDLPLDTILEKLSATELCSMAGVCSYLRDRCTSDHMWERHMNLKWGRVIGDTAFRSCGNKVSHQNGSKCDYLWSVWPISLVTSKLQGRNNHGGSLPINDSIMEHYLSLEKGKLWFVAQVYNRENGHGFMLSCYDAELNYDSTSDTFKARYSPRGRHTIEENISWDRLRAPPLDTPPYILHVSDCLEDLKPGDHFEIQWRRNKDYPYGWWYGVVGHLDSCIRNENWCRCHDSDMVMLEFNQYPVDSRWRRTTVNRRNHREQGNESDGFYGGIRKLYEAKEISTWKSIWPKNIIDQ